MEELLHALSDKMVGLWMRDQLSDMPPSEFHKPAHILLKFGAQLHRSGESLQGVITAIKGVYTYAELVTLASTFPRK